MTASEEAESIKRVIHGKIQEIRNAATEMLRELHNDTPACFIAVADDIHGISIEIRDEFDKLQSVERRIAEETRNE